MSEIADAVAGTVADLFGTPDEAPAEPVNSTGDAAAPQDAHEAALAVEPLATLGDPLPDDVAELLDAPDFDDIDTTPNLEYDPASGEYVDPDELARQLAITKKQLQWEQEQRLKASARSWSQEAKKYFPYSRPESIKASSRRAFLRAAKDQHDTVAVHVAPLVAKLEEERTKVREEVRVEAQAEAREAWGQPLTGAAPAPSAAAQKADDLNRMRARRDLKGVARLMMENGEL